MLEIEVIDVKKVKDVNRLLNRSDMYIICKNIFGDMVIESAKNIEARHLLGSRTIIVRITEKDEKSE